MSNKEKITTGNKFLIRSGGLALSLPVVIALSLILLFLSFLLAVVIMGGLLNLGDVGGVVSPYIPWLSLFLVLSLGTIVFLFRGVIRYTGGINQLWKRLRGIQEERARVERLMEKQIVGEDVEILDLANESQEAKTSKYGKHQ